MEAFPGEDETMTTETSYEHIETGAAPIKAWASPAATPWPISTW